MIKRNRTNDETLFDAYMDERHPEVKKAFSALGVFTVLIFSLKIWMSFPDRLLLSLVALGIALAFIYACYDFVRGLFFSDWLDK